MKDIIRFLQLLNNRRLLFTITLLFFSGSVLSKSLENDTIRLFIIGNSFSQNAAKYLPEIAKERGKVLTIGRAEIGGSSLERHWGHVEAAEANPEDPEGKPYNGKSLRMLLSEGTWDVVTLQQFSYLSSNLESFSPYAFKLYNYIKTLQPDAEIVFHQTWAYRNDAKRFGRVVYGRLAKDDEEMWQKSKEAYHEISKQLGTRIIPVGDAFRAVTSGTEYPFKKDVEFDYENPVYPNLPNQKNSLFVGYYWKGSTDFKFDPNHANESGRYLGSLVWYSFLFSESPEKINYMPKSLDKDFAAYLKEVAGKTLGM